MIQLFVIRTYYLVRKFEEMETVFQLCALKRFSLLHTSFESVEVNFILKQSSTVNIFLHISMMLKSKQLFFVHFCRVDKTLCNEE